jgi:hypothetical protein
MFLQKTKLTLVITGISLGLSVWTFPSAQAAQLTYDFTVDIDSGSLQGQTFSGFFRFEESSLTGNGFESVALTTNNNGEVSFEFNNTLYTQNDDPFDPTAEFNNNQLLGLSYVVPDTFSFELDFFNQQAYFYTAPSATGNDGAGDVSFSLRDSNAEPIPEPTTVVGSALALGMGAFFRRRYARRSQ